MWCCGDNNATAQGGGGLCCSKHMCTHVLSHPVHTCRVAPCARPQSHTCGAMHATCQAALGTRCLTTLASATSTSIRSPPGIRSNRKYRWCLSWNVAYCRMQKGCAVFLVMACSWGGRGQGQRGGGGDTWSVMCPQHAPCIYECVTHMHIHISQRVLQANAGKTHSSQ